MYKIVLFLLFIPFSIFSAPSLVLESDQMKKGEISSVDIVLIPASEQVTSLRIKLDYDENDFELISYEVVNNDYELVRLGTKSGNGIIEDNIGFKESPKENLKISRFLVKPKRDGNLVINLNKDSLILNSNNENLLSNYESFLFSVLNNRKEENNLNQNYNLINNNFINNDEKSDISSYQYKDEEKVIEKNEKSEKEISFEEKESVESNIDEIEVEKKSEDGKKVLDINKELENIVDTEVKKNESDKMNQEANLVEVEGKNNYTYLLFVLIILFIITFLILKKSNKKK